MLKLRLYRWFLLLLPPLGLATSITDAGRQFIQQSLLSRYDLRYEIRKDADDPLAQIIGVCNNGKGEYPNVKIEIALKVPGPRHISDISHGPYDSGPYTSFVEMMSRTAAFNRLPERPRASIKALLESRRSFNDAAQTFELLRNGRNYDGQRRLNEAWQAMIEEAREKWKAATGAELSFESQPPTTNDPLNQPISRIYILLPLKADSERFLRIRYGLTSVTSEVKVFFNRSSNETKFEVAPGGLRSPRWKMLIRHDTVWFALGLIILGLYLFGFIRSLHFPIHDLFNYAIRTNDNKAWEEALKKREWFIEGRFQNLASEQKKDADRLNKERLCYALRDRLFTQYGRVKRPFKNERELNKAIEKFLEEVIECLPQITLT